MGTITRRLVGLAVFAALGSLSACKNPERGKPGQPELPPLSAPAAAEAEQPAAQQPAAPTPTPTAPEGDAVDLDDEPSGAGADVPPSGSRASSTKPKGRKRSRDRSSHAAEPSAAAAPGNGDAIALSRLVVSKGVSGREPVGAANSFKKSDTEKVYAFVDIANPTREAGEVIVSFSPAGGGAGGQSVRLEVGSEARWRTWAVTRRLGPGAWTATVRASDGRELGRTNFEITP